MCGGLDTAAGLQGHCKAAWDCGRVAVLLAAAPSASPARSIPRSLSLFLCLHSACSALPVLSVLYALRVVRAAPCRCDLSLSSPPRVIPSALSLPALWHLPLRSALPALSLRCDIPISQ
jgi:hypothetical protein